MKQLVTSTKRLSTADWKQLVKLQRVMSMLLEKFIAGLRPVICLLSTNGKVFQFILRLASGGKEIIGDSEMVIII